MEEFSVVIMKRFRSNWFKKTKRRHVTYNTRQSVLMRYCVFLALKTQLLFTCQMFAGKPVQSNIYEFYNSLLSHIHALISYLHVHVYRFFQPLGSNHLSYSNCLSLMCVRWDRFLCRHIHLFCPFLVKVVCYLNDIMRSGYACSQILLYGYKCIHFMLL